ncbi:MAG: DUF3617 domain-containing protein [Sphingomicrobium sp.]
MKRTRLAFCLIAAVGGALTLAAAAQPSALAQTQAGLWEISGAPGAKAPLRQCIGNVATLAEFEHRGKNCSPKILSNSANSMVIQYSCGSAGFGRTQVDVITPRSLRIDTQGISAGLPFSYVLQARRIDDCPGHSPPGH